MKKEEQSRGKILSHRGHSVIETKVAVMMDGINYEGNLHILRMKIRASID